MIRMHLKHIQDYIDTLKGELHPTYRELIENSCNASLKALEKLLDEYNWKR